MDGSPQSGALQRSHPMALRCLRVGAVHSIIRAGFVMSAVCPVYPAHQTIPGRAGTSRLGQYRSFVHAVGSNRVGPQVEWQVFGDTLSYSTFDRLRCAAGSCCDPRSGQCMAERQAPVRRRCRTHMARGQTWENPRAFRVQVGPPQISIHQGQTVLITEEHGQINSPSEKGLYFFDTRVVSDWTIYANGVPWEPLSGGAISHWSFSRLPSKSLVLM
jgi:hypothetical protein